MNKIAPLLLLITLCSCAVNTTTTSNAYDVDIRKQGISDITTIFDTSIFKNPEIVFLETKKESAIKNIRKVELTENRIYVYDRLQFKILIFDRTGKYLKSLHSIGRGPREYIQITDFALDKDESQVIVFADNPGKLIYYDLDFNFIKEIPISTKELLVDMVVDNKYLYGYLGVSKSNNDIAVINKKDISKTNYFLPKYDNQPNFNAPGRDLLKTKNINFTRLFDYNIYQLDRGEIKEAYKLDFGINNLPEPYRNDKSFTGAPARKLINENSYVFAIKNIQESDKYIVFRTNLLGICILDKSSGKTNVYRFLNYSDYDLDLDASSIIPMNNSENKICFSLYTSVYSYKDFVDRRSPKIVNKKLYDLAHKININTNPALLLYEF